MKTYIYSAIIAACASVATAAQAQQKVYLNKGTDKVETVELADGDYIAFGRPEGVPMQRLAEIINTATTKNSISYTILGKTDKQPVYQMVLTEPFVQLFMEQYLGMTYAGATAEQFDQAFRTLFMAGYGYGQFGTKDYQMVDGVENELTGDTDFVFGGVNYYIVTCDLVQSGNAYALGDDLSYKVVKTAEPGESGESLDVQYLGLDDNGYAMFDITPGSGIKTLHTMLGTSKSVDQMVSELGFNYVMAYDATSFTAEGWNSLDAADKKWEVSKEDDYTFLAMGVDSNGDQVKKQLTMHLKPAVNDLCPEVSAKSFKVDNGNLSATFTASSKTSSPITKATVLLMNENAWDSKLNDLIRTEGYEKPSEGWPTVAAGEGAVDVTAALNGGNGEYAYTKSFTEAERGWYVLVFAVTDKNGTSITRTSFHTHIENAEPETISHTYPVDKTQAAAKKTAAKNVSARKTGNGMAAKTLGQLRFKAGAAKALTVK